MRSIFLIVVLIGVSSATLSSEIKAIRDVLLVGIDPLVRPESPIDVSLTFYLLGIRNLDSVEEILSVSGRLTAAWQSGVPWGVSLGAQAGVHLKEGEIWRPDLVIENTATYDGILADENVRYRLEPTGIVTWELLVNFDVYCQLNLDFYPLDRQTCYIAIASWTYSKDEVLLSANTSKINLGLLTENSEWDVDETQLTDAVVENVTAAHRSYSRLTFSVTLSRKSTFLGIHVILPLILTTVLMSLVFCITPGSNEKIGYSITSYLVNMVLYVSVCYQLPLPSIGTSMLGVYYTAILCLDMFVVLLAFVVTHVHNKTTELSQTDRMVLHLFKTLTCKKITHDIRSETALSQGTESTAVSVHDLNACSALQNGDLKDYKRHGRLSPINKVLPSELLETPNISPKTQFSTGQSSSSTDIKRQVPPTMTIDPKHQKVKDGLFVKIEPVTMAADIRNKLLWGEMSSCLDSIFFILFLLVSITIHIAFIVLLYSSV